jgi:deoxyribodipyrimidine photo-lyase
VLHKFIFELGWRAYFRHVWAQRGDGILQSLHAGPLPESAYRRELPAEVRAGRTGLPVVDRAVQTLYASGHLHNHARMWLASYAGAPATACTGAPAPTGSTPTCWMATWPATT